jgi:hypothetical protein
VRKKFHRLPLQIGAAHGANRSRENTGKSSLTISAKPIGAGAVSRRLILTGERSLLLMLTAMTESILLCVRMKG